MSEEFRLYLTDIKALEDPKTYENCYQKVSAARREKIDRMRMKQDKMLSLAAGLLLDIGLREYGLRESGVCICQGEQGKPFLADYPDIHFSLSHSKAMAMAVFSNHEIGCDIEFRKRTDERLAKRFFCPEEYAWMMKAADETERRERFYRLWTLKESYLKMTGWGLRLPLDSFCFSFKTQYSDSRNYLTKAEAEEVLLREEYEETSSNDRRLCEFEDISVNALNEYGGKYLSEDSVAILHAKDGQPYGVFEEYRIGEYSSAVCIGSEMREVPHRKNLTTGCDRDEET